MLQVEHFVVDDVFQHIGRHRRMVEDAADDNGVVRGIVVAENAAGLGLAPTHAGAGEQAVKESSVQVLEDGVEIVEVAAGGAEAFAPAHLANEVSFAHDLVTGHVFSVASCVPTIDWLAVHFGQQDMGDGPENRVWSALQQIGEPDQQASVAEADCVVDVGEGVKLDLQLGDGRRRAEFPIGFLKDFKQAFAHGEGRLARGGRQTSDLGPQASGEGLCSGAGSLTLGDKPVIHP